MRWKDICSNHQLDSIPKALVILIVTILGVNGFGIDVDEDQQLREVAYERGFYQHLERRANAESGGTAGGKTLGVPLKRRDVRSSLTEKEYGVWARRQADHLRARYGDRSSASIERRANGTAWLANHNTDSAFYATIGFGTPLEHYNIILDSGSADTWIASVNCQTGCDGVKKFSSAASSTYQNVSPSFLVQYGSATASGSLGRDVVQMAGYEVRDQLIALVDEVSHGLLSDPVSGLMGLAFKGVAASGGTPFWVRLAAAGVWDMPLMSFCLTRFHGVEGASSLEPGGYFTMGGVNSSLYKGEIDYVPLSIPVGTYWELPLTNLTVQGVSIPLPGNGASHAAIDTGTTLLGGPPALIDLIAAQIPGSSPGSGNYTDYFFYPCNTSVTATLSFGSRVWSIPPRDFELFRFDDGRCLSSFFRLKTSTKWIIGDTFLKNVYSVFRYDPPSIGFAELSETALAMNTVGQGLPQPSQGATVVIISAAFISSRISFILYATVVGLCHALLALYY